MKRNLIAVFTVFCVSAMIPSFLFAGGQQAEGDVQVAETAMAKEAPELAAMVESGELPSLEERLPETPYVQDVYDSIGRYGGEINRTWTGINDKFNVGKMTHDWLVRLDPTGTKVEPNIAKGWEISEDFTTYTFELRKGMKWSDGSPFTSDNVIFFWEHVMTQPEVFYNKDVPWWFKSPATGNPCRVQKIDETHFRLTFDSPFPNFLYSMATNYGDFFGHIDYLKTILPEFIGDDAAQKLAEEEGYPTVKEFLKWKLKYPFIWDDQPHVRAWIPGNSPREERYVQVRNPYYWKVDPEGNQLPYIDEIVYTFVQDKQMVNLKALAGEVDFQSRHMTPDNLSTFLENQDREDYRVVLNAPGFDGDTQGIGFNMTVKDEELRKVFENRDFRLGVSHAMDRESIVEIAGNGIGEPAQAAASAVFPFYDEAWTKAYTEYSPEKAAEYFDKAGLEWDADRKYRLRFDGKPIEIVFEVEDKNNHPKSAELIVHYLNEVGIKSVVKIDDRGLFDQRKNANELHMSRADWEGNPFPVPYNVLPMNGRNFVYGDYGKWYESDGAQGIEPTGDMAELYPLWQEVNSARTEAEKMASLEKIYEIFKANQWHIGLFTGAQPSYFIVDDKLRNVEEGALNKNYMRSPNNLKPWQLYYGE